MYLSDNVSTRFRVAIVSMLPQHTASPGMDTIIRAVRATQDGKEIAFHFHKYHTKIKTGKRSGGPAYHAHTICDINHQQLSSSPIRLSYIVINSAHGGEEVAHALIRMFDEQTDVQYDVRLPQDQIPPGKPHPIQVPFQSPVNGMISTFSYVPAILESATLMAAKGLVSHIADKVQARFTNCDGPIAYKSITLVDPLNFPKHHKLDISTSSPRPSLTRGAMYHMTAHIVGHSNSCSGDCEC